MRLFCLLLSGILSTGCLSTIEYSETFKPISRENSIFKSNTITSDFYKSSMAKAESGVFIENVKFQSSKKGFEGQYFVALLSTSWYWNREMIPIDASDVISNFYGIDFPPGNFGQKTEI